ncbi:DUF3168 domain-containing protein [Pseudooceanicola nanhaiensis]|uniref:DUF3168 domain-containing protein n=1 Tax=Pseudooceanicola nanhaiensis TaxID=375761 RepID=UPI001CD1FC63|nr:DUF3168 domain-containing protein [Pseudooceanicola nanhaiensis]MCA0923001.1 DUF3168 domain-containing protein [Pseudooceanicola nanhaiensis]
MEEELRARLLATASVTAICGTRINWGAHPQGAPWPGVILRVISDVEGHTLKGRNGVAHARVQIDCQADSYGGAKRLARAVRAALSGYRGGLLQAVLFADAREGREGGSNEADRPFRVSLDFFVHYTTT